ncbi:MAG: LTA synthase family protein [Clostridia bacterium]|nr:LTA synthase family protein [Clostridia bacterium]
MKKANNLNSFFNSFRKFYNNFKNFDYRQYTMTNILFLSFIISNLINSTLLRLLTVRNYFDVRPIVADVTFLILVGSFAYLIKGKKQFKYFFSISVILTAICVINSAYYNYYTSFSSFSLLNTLTQLSDVSDAVSNDILKISDFIFLLQPIFLIYVHYILNKKNYYIKAQKIEEKEKRFSKTVSFSVIIIVVFFITCTSTELSRFYKQWNREFTVSRFGVYTYQVNDLYKTVHASLSSSFGYDNAESTFVEYYENNKEEHKKNKYTNKFKGKNILLIHAESMQTFLMNRELNGKEITPTLNKLAKEGIFCSNFYSQVSTGTSSDSEFTLNTSLLPINSGTVFVSYWNRNYLSLQKLLKNKGYYSFSMHANNSTYWNRLAMHEKLGYDNFFAKDNYDIDDVIGLGLSDLSFFRQSVTKIKEIAKKEKNFIGTLITLTNHTPFYDVSEYTEFDVTMKYKSTDENGVEIDATATYLENTSLGGYIKSSHYADYALAEFISELDKEGILDDTVIVLYGDHDARISISEYRKMYNYDPVLDQLLDENDPNYKKVDYYAHELNRKVPFLIWSKNEKMEEEISTVMGMYDVLPTLANMFGFENSPYALGHDIINLEDNLVAFPNGNWLTNNIYYNSSKDEFSLLNDISIASPETIEKNSMRAESMLSVSQAIVVYDLLKDRVK